MQDVTKTVAACTLAVLLAAAQGATAVEISQAQVDSMMQRIELLERSSSQRQSSAPSQAAAEARKDAGVTADAATPAGVLDRFSVRGDFRYRHERIEDQASDGGPSAERDRQRMRARVAVDAKLTQATLLRFALASGGDDPRSPLQTLGAESSRKPIGLDLAHFDWKFASWAHLLGGKMKYPFVRAGQSITYDGDVNPEGLAFTAARGAWFASAYQFWIEERAAASDTLLLGGQVGARLPLRTSTLMLALQYSDLHNGEGNRPFYNCASLAVAADTIGCANGNTVMLRAAGDPVLAHDFDIVQLESEWSTSLGGRPLQLWASVAENLAASRLSSAWGYGVVVGRADAAGTWELGLAYQSTRKDAIFGQLTDSDFADGRTDGRGWIMRAGYAPARNLMLNTTYIASSRQMDVGLPFDYQRLQLDFNLKF
jgi:hypothetical protein